VRIDFDRGQIPAEQLPVGASMTVTVDTHDRSAPSLQSASNLGPVSQDAVFEDLNSGAEAIIEEVLAPFRASRWN